MIWGSVAIALRAMYLADDESGGLRALAREFYLNIASQTMNPPYLVCTFIDESQNHVFQPESLSFNFTFEISAYQDKDVLDSTLSALHERVMHVFNRKSPTITGWTANQIFFEGSSIDDEVEDMHVKVFQFTVHVAKTVEED